MSNKTPKIPLRLGVSRPVWSMKQMGNRQVSNNPEEDKKKILERDDCTCQFCGFRSEKYQEVFHINGFEDDFRDKNCLTACPFCYQCFYLDKVSEMRSGILIWLPEISQKDLNILMRGLYAGRLVKGGIGEAANKMIEALMNRREEATKRLGSDDPATLAIIFKDFLTEKHYQFAPKITEGIRLLPRDKRMVMEDDLEFNKFPQILTYWRSKNGPMADFTPDTMFSKFSSLIS